uniref:Uncharacterized protein n=1 Tax=Anguilla anguilla TaxID=7936 RepID=A0A0E9TRD2_ANGAN
MNTKSVLQVNVVFCESMQ